MPPRKGAKGKKENLPSPPVSPVSQAATVVEKIANQLELLYEPSSTLSSELSASVKALYDHSKESEPVLLQVSESLPTLLVDGFDHEQIWEQIKLQMDPFITKAERRLDYFTKRATDYENELAEKEKAKQQKITTDPFSLQPDDDEEDVEIPEEMNEDDFEDMMDEDMEMDMPNFDEDIYGNFEEDDDEESAAIRQLEDGFFDWDDMDRFADIGENEADDQLVEKDRLARRRLRIANNELEEDEEEGEEDDVDLAAHMDGAFDVRYEDFFLPPNEANAYRAKMLAKKNSSGVKASKTKNVPKADTDFFSESFGDAKTSKSNKRSKTMMDGDSDEEEAEEAPITLAGPGSSSTDYEIDDSEHLADHLLSSFEKKQKTMQAQIDAIEKQLVGPKAWDQGGETRAHMRDTDDLLTKHLDIEYAAKAAVPITEEVSLEIEEIIRQRCREGVFDDVQKRVPPPEKTYTPKEEVSAEKSKYGLAEVYEKEYMQAALGTDSELSVKLSKEHDEISTMFAALCHKLDALSNFFYTPKMPTIELSITSSTPAIQMEEVLPLAISDAQRMAPQEVFQSSTAGLLAAKSEQSQSEKQAARKARQEKKKKHFTVLEQGQKDAAAAGDAHAAKKLKEKDYAKTYKDATKNSKVTRAVNTDSTKYATSTQFFTKVQEEQKIDQSGGRRPKKINQESKKSVGSFMS